MPKDKFIPGIPGKEPDWDFLSRDIEGADFRRTPEVPFLPRSREAVGSLIETIGGDDVFRPELQVEDFFREPIDEGAEDIRDADTRVAMNKYFGTTREPAMEPLSREDIFPGRVGVRQVGTSGGPVTGPQPVFVSGGALFPFEILNARKRALERGAAAAGKAKKEFIKTWNDTVKFEETAPQYDQRARAQFVDWTNWTFNTLTEKVGGNGMLAGSMLLDPTTKEGQEFLKDIELWNSFSRNLKDIGLEAVKIAKEVRDGGEISKEMFKRLQEFQTAAQNPREFIEKGGDINIFREPFMIGGNLIDTVNKAMKGVHADIEAQLVKNRALPEVGNVLYKEQMDFILSGDRLNTLVDEIYNQPAFRNAGVTRERIKSLFEAKFNYTKESNKIIQDPLARRITFAKWQEDHPDKALNPFTELDRRATTDFMPSVVATMGNVNLSPEQKAGKLSQDYEDAFGMTTIDGKLWAKMPKVPGSFKGPVTTTVRNKLVWDERANKGKGGWWQSAKYREVLETRKENKVSLTDAEVNFLKIGEDQVFDVTKIDQFYGFAVEDRPGHYIVPQTEEIVANPSYSSRLRQVTNYEYSPEVTILNESGKKEIFAFPKIKSSLQLEDFNAIPTADTEYGRGPPPPWIEKTDEFGYKEE